MLMFIYCQVQFSGLCPFTHLLQAASSVLEYFWTQSESCCVMTQEKSGQYHSTVNSLCVEHCGIPLSTTFHTYSKERGRKAETYIYQIPFQLSFWLQISCHYLKAHMWHLDKKYSGQLKKYIQKKAKWKKILNGRTKTTSRHKPK